MLPLRDDIPSHAFPFVTAALILANAAVFAYQVSLGPEISHELIKAAAAVPEDIFRGGETPGLPPYLRLVSSLFLHGGLMHIAGNMLFLWIFGDSVEGRMGHFSFGLFYLACGILATLTHVWHNPDSAIPLIGASGAVSGILGAYILLFPRARIQVLVILFFFITTVKVPALVFIGGWAALQFINLSRGSPQIAWYAHIGGFAAGAVVTAIARPVARPERKPG